jgi:hypothetical protein
MHHLQDGLLVVLDAATLKVSNRFALPPHLAQHATPAAFATSPDSKLLVAGGRGSLLHVWDLAKGSLKHSVELQGSCSVVQLHMMPDSFTAAGRQHATQP